MKHLSVRHGDERITMDRTAVRVLGNYLSRHFDEMPNGTPQLNLLEAMKLLAALGHDGCYRCCVEAAALPFDPERG